MQHVFVHHLSSSTLDVHIRFDVFLTHAESDNTDYIQMWESHANRLLDFVGRKMLPVNCFQFCCDATARIVGISHYNNQVKLCHKKFNRKLFIYLI